MSRTIHAASTTGRLNDAWLAAPDYLRPVIAAVRDWGVGMLFVPQGPSPFQLLHGEKRPAIFIIGDDFDESRGPDGFHLPSVRRAIRICHGFAVVGSEATADIYAAVTAGAVAGGHVMIVETRPAHEITWIELIQNIAPGRPIIWGTVRGGNA